MKRLVALLFTVLLIGVFAACTSTPVSQGPANGPTGQGWQYAGPSPTSQPTGGITRRSLGQSPSGGQARPQPVTGTFQGCPAQGDGGDPELNQLKNRIDVGAWQPVTIASVLALTWPQSIERQQRSSWSASDRAAIAKYEGLPLELEGYLAGAKEQGPESCNCHSVDQVDFHLWIVDSTDKQRDQSVVVEVTPRIRAQHPGWTIERIRSLVDNQTKVRISGWLMMDPDHPDQIGKTRGTIWEIHPIVDIDVAQMGGWVALDHSTSAPPPGTPVPTQPNEPPPVFETPEPGVVVPTPNANGVGNSSSAVQITSIFAKGTGSGQPDEYVEIQNAGSDPVVMDGWSLHDAADHTFTWGQFTIQGGQTIRVYTNEVHQDTGGFSFQSSQPIWNNSGDTAYLLDGGGNIVATFHYGKSK